MTRQYAATAIVTVTLLVLSGLPLKGREIPTTPTRLPHGDIMLVELHWEDIDGSISVFHAAERGGHHVRRHGTPRYSRRCPPNAAQPALCPHAAAGWASWGSPSPLGEVLIAPAK